MASLALAAGQAAAAIIYVSHDRLARATFTGADTVEQSSAALGSFDVAIHTIETGVGSGAASQTSFLGSDFMNGTGGMGGSGHNGRRGVGLSEVHSTFDVLEVTPYALELLFTPHFGTALNFSLRFSGPGVFHDFASGPGPGGQVPVIDRRGTEALMGTLAPGRYTLDVIGSASGSGGPDFSGSASFLFSLVVPSPGTTAAIGVVALFVTRRRR